MNKIEAIKDAKHPLDVLPDLFRYAELGWEAIPEDDFERLKWYGVFHRRTTPGYFMLRLRAPGGMLTTAQLATVAGIIQDYGRDQADLTTRESIQLRWVRIEDVPVIFERLAAVGLTTFQSGMDSMRNVTGCPMAGLDPSEVLDATPQARAIEAIFVGDRELSNLPRKINFAITGCVDDCIHAQAHDVAFVPARYHDAERTITGFNVLLGGALGGRDPQFAAPLNAFVTPDHVAPFSRALLTVFRDFGPREARTKARLKVLVNEWGMERLRAAIEERFGLPLLPAGEELTERHGGDHIGVHPQQQAGYATVGLCVPVGRVTGTLLAELATLAERYGQGGVRLTPDQNVLIPNVANGDVAALLAEPLLQTWRADPTPMMRGLVCCTGNDYCHFALVDTKGEALKLAQALDATGAFTEPVTTHFSGCPNACGMHHTADIGLLGQRVKRDGQIIDVADVAFGGRLGADPQIATPVASAISFDALPTELLRLLEARLAPAGESPAPSHAG